MEQGWYGVSVLKPIFACHPGNPTTMGMLTTSKPPKDETNAKTVLASTPTSMFPNQTGGSGTNTRFV